MEVSKIRKQVRPRPEKDKVNDKDKSNTRIVWARSLTDPEIVGLLQMKLLESRARRGTRVGLLNELVHEIKHRLERGQARSDER